MKPGNARCDVCGNRVAVRQDGRLRRHGWKWHPEQGYCRGSEMTVVPDAGTSPPMSDGMYSTADVVRLAGCTYRQIDYWVRTGVVEPTVRAKNSGFPHRWSERDLLLVRVAVRLVDGGLALASVRSVVTVLGSAFEGGGDDETPLFIVRYPDGVVGILTEDGLRRLFAPGPKGAFGVFHVDVRSALTPVGP